MYYLEHLQTAWTYAPYALYAFYLFVFLTLLPKSLARIKSFAAADYKANHSKYHRCYGPDICCHTFAEQDGLPTIAKPRKAVQRVYVKKQSVTSKRQPDDEQLPAGCVIRRQVQVSAIPTHKHVTQIAQMFESGSASKKINRITPTLVPELRANATEHCLSDSLELQTSGRKVNSKLSQLLQENIENSVNLLNSNSSDLQLHDDNWSSQSLSLAPTVVRRTRANPPSTLTFAGSSATPSTASPAISTPHSSSSPLSESPGHSPLLRNAPILNLKSSLEDIFAAIARNAEQGENFIYAGCSTLSPVTSIDDILSQRRLSRPLSAYSISDLLKEESTA